MVKTIEICAYNSWGVVSQEFFCAFINVTFEFLSLSSEKKINFQDIIHALLFSPLAKAQAIAPPLMAVNTIKIITLVNA